MNNEPHPYLTAFRGSFTGILRWPQLDEFWDVLRAAADDGWYVYAIGDEVPQAPVKKQKLLEFIDEVDALLRKEHQEDYCGVVYVDDRKAPAYIKIFDPNNLGVSCGYSDMPPLPGWIISRMPPAELSADTLMPANRKRWWQKIFS